MGRATVTVVSDRLNQLAGLGFVSGLGPGPGQPESGGD